MRSNVRSQDTSDSAIIIQLKSSGVASDDVLVTESDHEVILSGSVDSFVMKQAAQEAIRTHVGQRRLHNQIIVAH
jgi:osmotically-inducible protein OsmY